MRALAAAQCKDEVMVKAGAFVLAAVLLVSCGPKVETGEQREARYDHEKYNYQSQATADLARSIDDADAALARARALTGDPPVAPDN
jgi:hypothetical protein